MQTKIDRTENAHIRFPSGYDNCVDALTVQVRQQRSIPSMTNILPQLEALSQYHAARTIFTRFIPSKHRDDAVGAWNDYYRKWWMITVEHLEGERLDLLHLCGRLRRPRASLHARLMTLAASLGDLVG